MIAKGARPDAVEGAILALTREECEAFIEAVSAVLYWNGDEGWDYGKEWHSTDFLDTIAQALPDSIRNAVETITKKREANE